MQKGIVIPLNSNKNRKEIDYDRRGKKSIKGEIEQAD